jgi:preprotein translocase subunit SecA
MQDAPPVPMNMQDDFDDDFSELHDNAAQIEAAGMAYGADEDDYYSEPVPTQYDQALGNQGMPGPNDACPCGSGKKFKDCHGKHH